MQSKLELMFSFFQKSEYLVDFLEGTTDFHNHVLPGIDDGAKDLDESVQLLKAFKSIGIDRIVATPHVMGEYYPNTPDTINSALEKLGSTITSIELTAAAEYMMDQYFSDIIDNEDILTIKNNKVLVEMSYFQPPINLSEILFKLQNHSFAPILAHPERYGYMHSSDLNKYKDLKTRGCEFQLNMLSLTDHYGKGIQRMAFKLIENNFIDYISSDAHKMEHLEKIKKIKIPGKYEEIIKSIIQNNKILFSN